MKKSRQFITFYLWTMAFWGILYPEFSLGKNTYLHVEEDGGSRIEEQNPEEDLWEILESGGENIVIKSKLWEWLQRGCKR